MKINNLQGELTTVSSKKEALLCSRAMVGMLSPDALLNRKDENGTNFIEVCFSASFFKIE